MGEVMATWMKFRDSAFEPGSKGWHGTCSTADCEEPAVAMKRLKHCSYRAYCSKHEDEAQARERGKLSLVKWERTNYGLTSKDGRFLLFGRSDPLNRGRTLWSFRDNLAVSIDEPELFVTQRDAKAKAQRILDLERLPKLIEQVQKCVVMGHCSDCGTESFPPDLDTICPECQTWLRDEFDLIVSMETA